MAAPKPLAPSTHCGGIRGVFHMGTDLEGPYIVPVPPGCSHLDETGLALARIRSTSLGYADPISMGDKTRDPSARDRHLDYDTPPGAYRIKTDAKGTPLGFGTFGVTLKDADYQPLLMLPTVDTRGNTDTTNGLVIPTGLTFIIGQSNTGKSLLAKVLIDIATKRQSAETRPMPVVIGEESVISDLVMLPCSQSVFYAQSCMDVFPLTVVDSLTYLLSEESKGGSGAGGISRSTAKYFSSLDVLLRVKRHAAVVLLNPLMSRGQIGQPSGSAYESFRELIKGTACQIIECTAVDATNQFVRLHVTSSSRAATTRALAAFTLATTEKSRGYISPRKEQP